MADVSRLIPFQDLALVGDFAERFGRDPDEVFWKTSFDTVINFAVEQKEKAEYRERFADIWQQLTDDSTGSDTGGEHGRRDSDP